MQIYILTKISGLGVFNQFHVMCDIPGRVIIHKINDSAVSCNKIQHRNQSEDGDLNDE